MQIQASDSSLSEPKTGSDRKWGLPRTGQTHAYNRVTFRELQRPEEEQGTLLKWEEVFWPEKSIKSWSPLICALLLVSH